MAQRISKRYLQLIQNRLMKIYSALKIGEFHPVFCEDFNVVEKLSENWMLIAVMDGCSSGKDSHFASALFGEIIKKIAKNIPYWDFQKTETRRQ